MGADEFEQLGMDGAPDGRTHRGLRGRAAGQGDEFVEARHVVERNFDAQVDALGLAGVDDGDGAVDGRGGGGFEFGEDLAGGVGGALLFGCGRGIGAAEKAGDFVERALRGGESDALQLAAAQVLRGVPGRGRDALPRLVGTRAWISSRTTVSTERSTSRALEVSRR